MVRVAGLKQQLTGEVGELAARRSHARTSSSSKISAARARARRAADDELSMGDVMPRARRATARSSCCSPSSFRPSTLAILDERFHNEVFPILTPIAIDPGHPFPHVRNKSLNLGVMFSREGDERAGLRRRAGADDAAAPHRGAGHADAPSGDVRAARVRPARGPHRAPRRHDLPRRAPQGRLRLPRHAQLRPRDRRGGGAKISSRRSSRSSGAASAATRCASRSHGEPPSRLPREARAGAQARSRARRLPHPPFAQRLRSAGLGRRATSAATSATSPTARSSCRRSATPTTSSRPSASATSSSTTRTSRSIRSSSSSRAPPRIPTCSRSSRRSTAPAATRRS